MKYTLTILAGLFLLAACDNREDQVGSFNDAPYFTLDGDTVNVIVDSLKISAGNYTVLASFVDPNKNLKTLEVSSSNPSGSFALGGVAVVGGSIDVENQSVSLTYFPSVSGSHKLVITQIDAFDEMATLDLDLRVFTNLLPVARFEVESPEGAGSFERNVNASSSRDLDVNFGGRIVEYEYSFLGKVITGTNNNQTIIFPSNGVYNIVVRVQDNDGVWSEPVSKNVNI